MLISATFWFDWNQIPISIFLAVYNSIIILNEIIYKNK